MRSIFSEMIFISEKNNHNQAYQILVDYYIEKPDKEQKLMLNNLFMEWSKSGKHALLNHLIEIIEVHESKEIRELALKNLRKNLPIKKQEAIIEIWITHPTPSLRDYIKELVEDNNSRKSLIAAAYVMLSDWHALNIIDPDYKHLDNYLKDLDSLLGSLLFDRIKKLKTTALGEKKGLTTSIEQEELSVIDLIRRKDYFTLWENILEYPLPFI